ncbi:site-specific tyrosine recombinase/integron integrase [Stygiolobus caldivivus]|uniref:Tyrosine recombinase XerA n=1 Tax=Stygiolobus caldivivus TaxID=2824673 RepID=A0A8D5U830_9CREN|nr:site-specific tyrosine recombinase/integron integrase [Stygiolobus caldivivus]BCU70775.1 recombinase XerD [Stygiolobus caldivivus]
MKLQLGSADPYTPDPFNDFINALTISGASDNTIRIYSIAIKDFLDFIKKDPREVTSADLNSWIMNILRRETRDKSADNSIEKRRKKTVTARLYVIAVLRFLKWLGKDVKPTIPRVRRLEVKALTEDQIEVLMKNLRRTRDKLIISLLLDTGLRAKELLSVKVSDVNLSNRSIVVRNTKNGETRVVFFTEKTAKLLLVYLEKYRPKKDDRLFDLSYYALYRKLKRLGKKLGVDLRPHILRHTFATNAIRKGVPLPIVQRLLGHKDIRTTQIYTHLVNTDIEEMYKKIFG